MKRLVIVVGAGASAEVGLPVGAGLTKSVQKLLEYSASGRGRPDRGDETIFNAISERARPDNSMQQYLAACERIRRGMLQAKSIDNFIDSNQDDPKIAACGKLAIASAILSAERDSDLFSDHTRANSRIDFEKVRDTWYGRFFDMINEHCLIEDVPARLARITIICFNYDRCIEHFLLGALQNYYSCTASVAIDAIRRMTIYHPFGVVGLLPAFSTERATDVPFGIEPHWGHLRSAADQLRTFTEGVSDDDMLSNIRSRLRSADLLLFLGFAYHPQNLKLLFGDGGSEDATSVRQVLGTAFGMSDYAANSIRARIERAIHPTDLVVLDTTLKCAEIFRTFSPDLTLTDA